MKNPRLDDDLKQLITDTAVETRRHFDVVVEAIEKKVAIVAEGVTSFSRLQSESRSDMDRGFEETQAMIRLSYAAGNPASPSEDLLSMK